jgi:hypothetical protein
VTSTTTRRSETKPCRGCREELPRAEFTRDRRASDGLASRCRRCTRERVRSHRRQHRERCRARDRQRDRTARRRAHLAANSRRWEAANPDKHRAQRAVRQAVATGRLEKPDACQRCSKPCAPRALHGHHTDYSQPLEVEWLCAACHAQERDDVRGG